MKLPNAEHAVIDIRKLSDYCLNPSRDEGKHKARLFAAELGMTANDGAELRDALLQAVLENDARLGRPDDFGQRYTVDFLLEWHGKRAVIRSGWIIEHDSDTSRLTTCYPV